MNARLPSGTLEGVRASVCICTYNGAGRICAVLDALAAQPSPADLWELLVIDNASTDGTGTLAARRINDLLGGHGRVVHESRPGLSFARARAAAEACGSILCFLDDDNIPAPTFVACAIDAFKRRPKAGVIGGRVLPRWEVPPTALAEAVAPFALAICDLGNAPKQVDGSGSGIVGAGMCARRDVLCSLVDSGTLGGRVTGRSGASLMSGEDIGISIAARQMGYECWYDPSLVVEHLLPPRRMEKDYLQRLYQGIGRGQAAVRRLYDWKARSPLGLLIALKDLGRWIEGSIHGPDKSLRVTRPDLARDLHDLDQALLLGRSRGAVAFWR